MLKRKVNSFFSSPPRKFIIHLSWGLTAGVILLLVFANLAEGLLYHELGAFDTGVARFIQSFANSGLTKVAVLVTLIGSPFFDIIVMAVAGSYLLFRLMHAWEAIALFISLSGGGLLDYLLKNIFHRARPDIPHLVKVSGYSFPSGHAMVSTAFYGMLGYLIWYSLRTRRKPSWHAVVLTAVFIFAIGVSRIYLGVHFPSDVLAGFAAGGIWLIACIIGLNAIRHYKS